MAAPVFLGLPIPDFVKAFITNLATGFANAKFTITFTSVIAGVLTVSFSAVGVGRLRGETLTFAVPNENAGAGLVFLAVVVAFFVVKYYMAKRAISSI